MTDGWLDVGAESDIRPGRPLTAEIDGVPVMVVRCMGAYYAIEDRCTHDGESLAGGDIEDCEIVCPRHFARFDLKTGEALTPPAYEPVRTYPVRAENGRILIRA
ncbi:MAG TPA: non-heme iron oxygenase ferredoxin subunit [Steroidobacteraceae bacterium]|nr:non-heme iron oxygenase ferredoxin subunit [Steroidobacteraceae bacterium]